MLVNILKFFDRFLTFILLLIFGIFIYTQYRIFMLKISLKEIDSKIIDIKNKNAVLDVEIAFLTNPERLIKIYKETYKIDYNEKLPKIKQMKDITDLLFYYNGKNKSHKND